MNSKFRYHTVFALPACLFLLAADFSIAANPSSPGQAPPVSAISPLVATELVGGWVGVIDLPKDQAGKEKVRTTIVLAFYSDGKCGLVFFEPANDIDPKGERGLTYDHPLTGTWKLIDGVATLTPDPEEYPDVKPIALALTQPEKNRLELDLTSMTEQKNAFGKKVMVTFHPATEQQLEQWFCGKRPE